MTVTEKAAYLRGLAEGLKLDPEKPETKIINSMMDLLDDLALTVSDLEDGLGIVSEQLDEVDEDLDAVERFIYEGIVGDDEDLEDEYYDVECPKCGEVICVDARIIEDGEIDCPNCGEALEFDIVCECEDCCDDDDDDDDEDDD
ncbi:MAG: CD1247 N-terminal domain-containing protein [Acutalibacteraceae bacterium]|jgi:hypothetical protein